MKTLLGLILAAAMVLALGSVALAGLDFTLEFSHDIDAGETAGFVKAGFSVDPEPLSISLTWKRTLLPDVVTTVDLGLGLTFGALSFGYDRELTIDDPGAGTIKVAAGPIKLGYAYDFGVDTSGKITATLSKSF